MKTLHPSFLYLVFLSTVAALGGFLFGYDTAVISGTITQVSRQFELDVLQQGWYVGCALVGSIAGVSVAGWLSDRFGRKKVMFLAALLFTASAFGCAVAAGFGQLVFFRIVGGAGIGMVSIISPMYISEMAISAYRGSLVSLYQLAITVGFLGAYLVNFQLQAFSDQISDQSSSWVIWIFRDEVWRGMLGMEFIPAMAFFVLIFFIPESPRWLLVQKQEGAARVIFARIYQDAQQIQWRIEEVYTNIARASDSGWSSLWQPQLRRPVLIGVAIAILGQFMGVNAVLYYGPTIFEQSGLSSGDALFYQVWVGLVNVLTTVLALFIIDRVGRKSLVYFGVTGMIVTLLAIGVYFWQGEALGIGVIWLLVLFIAYIFFTAISISAVIFVLLSEMYPNRVRGIAMSIAGLSLWVGTYLVGQLTPWFLENLGPSGTFFLFALMCLPYMYIIWKMIPETAGKSLEEIEQYWLERKS
ncbi:sugar porter family MFS transporter [Lunatimonas salinarum]|uniref:sugar porter family MFS transporter n=1 Tax=Lunatimonas salinarum TaxID=1774590 RepID=UPI001ADFEAA8|nr:sugar porter family MFS transporter [Lunatimonas salinarum]